MEDAYGVIKIGKETLFVEMLDTGETEEIKKDWLSKQIQEGKIDISKSGESLEYFQKTYLSDYLPNSS